MFYFKDSKKISVYLSNGKIAEWSVDNPQFEKVHQTCIDNDWIAI